MSRIDEIKELTGASSVTYENGFWLVRWQELFPHYILHFDVNSSDKYIKEKAQDVRKYYDRLLEQRAYEERVRQEEFARRYPPIPATKEPEPEPEPPERKAWKRPLRNKARMRALKSGRVMK